MVSIVPKSMRRDPGHGKDGPFLDSRRVQRRHAKLEPIKNYIQQKNDIFSG